MQSFLKTEKKKKEAPLCLILGCVSKSNLKTRSSLPCAPSRLRPFQPLRYFSFWARDLWGSLGM